jgi:hypothetical protein
MRGASDYLLKRLPIGAKRRLRFYRIRLFAIWIVIVSARISDIINNRPAVFDRFLEIFSLPLKCSQEI